MARLRSTRRTTVVTQRSVEETVPGVTGERVNSIESLSPEAMLIIALVKSGEWCPGRYGVTEEMVTGYRKVWRFCSTYAETSGTAPDASLVRTKYPDFPWEDISVDVGWAAGEVVKHHGGVTFRNLMRQAITLLDNDDVRGASALMRSWSPPGRAMAGQDVFDSLTAPEANDGPRWSLPWDSLNRVVGGLVPGDLWYVSGRPGEGKSWTLTAMVSHLLLHYEVSIKYFSLEMPARDMARRVVAAMTSHPRQAAKFLYGSHEETMSVVADVRAKSKGVLTMVDPSSGSCDPSAIAEAGHTHDVVVVDHMGLVRTGTGGRVVDDWRAMHAVSNELKEIALSTTTVVLAASQLNRSSEASKETTTAHLSQSDALGQDADVVLALRRPAPEVAHYSVVKNRRGPTARWYTNFAPASGMFAEIDKDEAESLVAEA